jgi:hypothetical protein
VHENWYVIGDYLNIYGWSILSLMVLIIGGRLLYVKYFKGRSKGTEKGLKK